jgi:ATP-dependent Clp protease adaptor protein ClpS
MPEVEPAAPPTEAPTKRERPTPTEQEIHLPQYHVILLDDDDHSYAYVIEMLGAIFGHSKAKAFKMAVEVDATGRVIVDTTTKERAELKRDQIHNYGPDWRIEHCRGSMQAVVEPAGEEG